MTSPPSVIGEPGPSTNMLPGLQAARYVVMGVPPLLADKLKAKVACALPGTADNMTGAVGGEGLMTTFCVALMLL